MRVDPQTGEKQIPFPPSTFETIDGSVLQYIKGLKLHTTTNKGFRPVPVLWAGTERSFKSKDQPELRDSQGALVFPLISVERTSVSKNPQEKGVFWGNIPPVPDAKGGSIPIARTINQEKTANFANSDAKIKRGQINFPRPNKKIVYRTYSMPMPVYVSINYVITFRTEYQQQMNELVTPFVTKPGGINYVLLPAHEGHRYEGFIQQDFTPTNNATNMSTEERKFETKINIKVLGYLIGEDKNQEKPCVSVRENFVEVKMPRERLMLGDIPQHELGSYYGLAGFPPGVQPGDPRTAPSVFSGFNRASNLTVAANSTTIVNIDSSSTFIKYFEDIYIIKEYAVRGNVAGDGSVTYNLTNKIRENSETVYHNGMLGLPGAAACELCEYSVDVGGQSVTFHPANGVRSDPPDEEAVILITYIRN